LQEGIIKHRGRGSANVQHLYHATRGDIAKIAEDGLDPRRGRVGNFFGAGIYFAKNPLKANDYSPSRGYASHMRVMLRCRVALGIPHVLPPGQTLREAVKEPQGRDSVMGWLRRDAEYIVYRATQVDITQIVIYSFTAPAVELLVPITLPITISSTTYAITPVLLNFFTVLLTRATAKSMRPQMTDAIHKLLAQTITAAQFISLAEPIVGSPAAPSAAPSIEAELLRVRSSAVPQVPMSTLTQLLPLPQPGVPVLSTPPPTTTEHPIPTRQDAQSPTPTSPDYGPPTRQHSVVIEPDLPERARSVRLKPAVKRLRT
jgi:hypothetical protein